MIITQEGGEFGAKSGFPLLGQRQEGPKLDLHPALKVETLLREEKKRGVNACLEEMIKVRTPHSSSIEVSSVRKVYRENVKDRTRWHRSETSVSFEGPSLHARGVS